MAHLDRGDGWLPGDSIALGGQAPASSCGKPGRAVVLTTMLVTAGLVVWRYLSAPTTRRAKQIETLAGLWTILLYLSIGAIPLLWRWWLS